MNFDRGIEFLVKQEAKRRQKRVDSPKPDIISVNFVIKLLQEIKLRSINWTIYDFEQRARENEEWHSGLDFGDEENEVPIAHRIYDRKKFEDALLLMIREHDANNGISWDTIDFYLDEYCR